MASPTPLLLLLLLTTPALADPGDDFSNNLFSDLAPLLTLFGEQVAKQFLSQSLHWLDNVVFAMAPLGIITGMVSAIRVGGPRWLRAVIGRARESKGDAEVELMSSTSGDVCELWNGDTVVRTLGAPSVVEVVFLEKVGEEEGEEHTDRVMSSEISGGEDGEPDSNGLAKTDHDKKDSKSTLVDDRYAGVFSFEEAEEVGLFRRPGYSPVQPPSAPVEGAGHEGEAFPVFELGGMELHSVGTDHTLVATEETDSTHSFDLMRAESGLLRPEYVPSAPNISLNAGVAQGSYLELAIVAIAGTLIQAAVLAFAGAITYTKGLENRFFKNGHHMASYAYPLTAIGTILVTIGMYLCSMVVQNRSVEEKWVKMPLVAPPGYRIRTAWLQKAQVVTDQAFPSCVIMAPADGQYHLTSRPDPALKSQHAWVVIGSSVSVAGFVCQFSGLRGMHFSVTLAQLGATLVMSFLRILVRRQLSLRPAVETVTKSHELEWMTRMISGCRRWRVLPVPIKSTADDRVEPTKMGLRSFKIRTRLSAIARWGDDPLLSSSVASLILAMEGSLNYLYNSTITLDADALEAETFTWYVYVNAKSNEEEAGSSEGPLTSSYERIGVSMTRIRHWEDGTQVWGGWQINRTELEAALSLWVLDIRDQELIASRRDTPAQRNNAKGLFLLGLDSALSRLDYETFIGRGTKLTDIPHGLTGDSPIPMHRRFGFADYSKPGASHVGVYSFSTTEEFCQRHLFACFFAQAARLISCLNGTNALRRNPDATDNQCFRLENSNLKQLTEIVHNAGLGTPEAILMTLVPPLRHNGNLLRASNAFDVVVEQLKQMSDPVAAEAMEHRLFYLCEEPLSTLNRERHWDITGDYVFGLASAFKKIFGDDDRRTARAMSLVRRFCENFASVVRFQIGTMENEFGDSLYGVLAWIKATAGELLGADSDLTKPLERLESEVSSLGKISTDVLQTQQIIAELPADVPAFMVPPSSGAEDYSSVNTRAKYGFIYSEDYPKELWTCLTAGDLRGITFFFKDWDRTTSWHQDDSARHLVSSLMLAATMGWAEICRYLLGWRIESLEASSSANQILAANDSLYGKLLQLAAEHGHLSIVDTVMELVPKSQLSLEINSVQHTFPFFTPLQLACKNGHFEIANLLLLAGADTEVDMKIDSGMPEKSIHRVPIGLAAVKGNERIVSLLLFYGANGNFVDEKGNSIAHYAALFGKLAILQLLINHKLDVVHSSNENEETPLHLASRGNNRRQYECIKALHSAGVDVDARDQHGLAAIHIAANGGAKETVELLLSLGADPYARDRMGRTPLHSAALGGNSSIVEILVSRGADIEERDYSDQTPLTVAVEAGAERADMVLDLLKKFGANVNASTNLGRTSLHLAARLGKIQEVLGHLLNAGADITLRDVNGRNALHTAALSNNDGFIDTVLSSRDTVNLFGDNIEDDDADDSLLCVQRRLSSDILDHRDNKRYTPLLLALEHGNLAAARCLISHDADATALTKDGKNAVQVLVLKILGAHPQWVPADAGDVEYEEEPIDAVLTDAHVEMLLLLLERGVDINHAGDGSYSALHYAAEWSPDGEHAVAEFLVEHGADVNQKGKNGEGPLRIAAEKGNVALVKYLLAVGAHVDGEKFSSPTPLTALLMAGVAHTPGQIVLPADKVEEILEVLLEAGASADASISYRPMLEQGYMKPPSTAGRRCVLPDWDALYWAVRSGQPSFVKALLKHGVDARILYGPEYDTPLIRMFTDMEKFRTPYTPETAEIVDLLINTGVDVNHRDVHSLSALSYALQSRQQFAARDLLNHGAEIDEVGVGKFLDAPTGVPVPSSEVDVSELRA